MNPRRNWWDTADTDTHDRGGSGMTDETALRLERNCLWRELDRIRNLTGQVKHTNPDECYGCGCYSLTAEEAVIYALRELRAELAEQKAANLALAERLAACSAVLSKAAERGKVCGGQPQPEGEK